MRCSKCGTNNPPANNFCAKCGDALARRCAKCAAENPPTSIFCGKCGARLADSAAASAPSEPQSNPAVRVLEERGDESLATDGERKTVTALFADIKGSTELEQDLDPEEARAIVDPALKLMIDAVRRYDGYIVQSTGDGIFALFGAPVAHEDHPQRALYAALRMQEELRRYSAKLVAEGGNPLQCRVGVNTGEVVVRSIATGDGQVEYTPIGHTTNLASRMQAVAPVGSIAVAEPTRNLCEGYFALKPMGPTRVKGVSEPVNVYEVTGLGPLRTRLQRSAGRGLTKFVGREREMEAMRNAAQLARGGRGQIVAAMAEAGTGKSRLFFEFKAKNQSGWMVLEAFSVSHGKASAYFPVIDLLHSYFKITGDDDQRARRAKVTGNVLTLDRALEDTLPYLFALLGIVEGEDPLGQMDAQIKKRRTLDAIKRILLRESLNQPLMVIFEDLHWIDSETQAFLNLLADSIATARILLLVNYRPEYSHQWNSKTYYTQLRLDPLGKESAEEMLTAMLGDGAEVRPLKRLIIEKTEGNPFFMEETVQVLLDEGALVRNGAVKLTKSLSQLKIPPTVQAILAARIDRLPPAERELLQTLAVVGKEFSLELLKAVTGKTEAQLDPMLSDLQLSEFIYEQASVAGAEYTFKHALTQEVSYNSVLVDRRKRLHERTGATLETLYASSLEDHLAELAHHYSRSPNVTKAIEYLGRAGEQFAERSAFGAAAASVEAGLKLIDAVPEGAERARLELRLQMVNGQLQQKTASVGSPAAVVAFRRARDLCIQLADDRELFSALNGLRWSCMFRSEMKKARELAEEQRSIATRSGDPVQLMVALGALGEVAVWMGDFSAARDYLEQLAAITVSGDAAHRLTGRNLETQVIALSLLESALFLMGFADQAASRREKTLGWVRGLSQGYSTYVAPHIAGMTALRRRAVPEALELSQRAVDEASEQGLAYSVAVSTVINAAARSRLTNDESALDQMRRAIELSEADEGVSPTWLLLPLAEECLRFGRTQECAELIENMLERIGMDQRWEESEIYRVQGEMSLTHGDSHAAEGEDRLRKAVEVARHQGAKFLELRATMSLARLLRDTNRRDEARAMLAEIYNWFTEGFDTADLKDARTLLDELSI
jgi:class 3 adenylate cyclase/tetratricopeptide (TPR) repeat protein